MSAPESTTDAADGLDDGRGDASDAEAGHIDIGEPESLNLTVTVPHALEELEHLAVERGDEI